MKDIKISRDCHYCILYDNSEKYILNQNCWYSKCLYYTWDTLCLFLACRLSGSDWEAAKCDRRIPVQRITGHHDCYVMDLREGEFRASAIYMYISAIFRHLSFLCKFYWNKILLIYNNKLCMKKLSKLLFKFIVCGIFLFWCLRWSNPNLFTDLQCELYHWSDILDKFDEIMEKACKKETEKWTLACDLPSNERVRLQYFLF